MEKIINISIIVLALIAIGLGYMIFQSKRMQIFQESSNVVFPSVSEIPSISAIPSNADEILVLQPPLSNAKKEDITRYHAAVEKLAQDSTSIKIDDNCIATPRVARMKIGTTFSITNQDNYPHLLSFEGPSYTIPPKGIQELTATFNHGDGIYAYTCDKTPFSKGNIAGVLMIIK